MNSRYKRDVTGAFAKTLPTVGPHNVVAVNSADSRSLAVDGTPLENRQKEKFFSHPSYGSEDHDPCKLVNSADGSRLSRVLSAAIALAVTALGFLALSMVGSRMQIVRYLRATLS